MTAVRARAAVLTAVGAPIEIWDVEVGEPRAGEVRVRMAAAGVCHSDLAMQQGTIPMPLPVVLGHEGAGFVDAVGDGVEGLSVGDLVVVSWVAQCGACFYCQRGDAHLCVEATRTMSSGGMADGTVRFTSASSPSGHVYHALGTGTFAETTVVPAIAVVKVDAADIDPVMAALLGCGVVTGVGAALNTASIRPGDTVVVVGCGGVGLNVVQGARMAGAGRIVAVDVHPHKLELATAMGATDGVVAAGGDTGDDIVGAVMDLTGQHGADVVFEVIGRQETIEQAFWLTRRGGQAVLVGIPAMDVVLQIPAMVGLVLSEKSVKGCWLGSANIRRDVPRLVDRYRSGELLLDELVSRRIDLSEVDDAFAAMESGEVARSVIVF